MGPIMFQTVLDPMEVFKDKNLQSQQKMQSKRLENRLIYGIKYREKEGLEIQGLFSTNPEDYLLPEFQIGNII